MLTALLVCVFGVGRLRSGLAGRQVYPGVVNVVDCEVYTFFYRISELSRRFGAQNERDCLPCEDRAGVVITYLGVRGYIVVLFGGLACEENDNATAIGRIRFAWLRSCWSAFFLPRLWDNAGREWGGRRREGWPSWGDSLASVWLYSGRVILVTVS